MMADHGLRMFDCCFSLLLEGKGWMKSSIKDTPVVVVVCGETSYGSAEEAPVIKRCCGRGYADAVIDEISNV